MIQTKPDVASPESVLAIDVILKRLLKQDASPHPPTPSPPEYPEEEKGSWVIISFVYF